MTRWQKYAFAAAVLVVAGSGGGYFWMQHFVESDDPFAVVNHPWQPAMLAAHILSAPVLLFLFGLLFEAHVVRRIEQTSANRKTGLASLAMLFVMIGSGYLLQVTTAGSWRQAWLVAHLTSGGLFGVAYAIHLVGSARLWRAQRASERSRAA